MKYWMMTHLLISFFFNYNYFNRKRMWVICILLYSLNNLVINFFNFVLVYVSNYFWYLLIFLEDFHVFSNLKKKRKTTRWKFRAKHKRWSLRSKRQDTVTHTCMIGPICVCRSSAGHIRCILHVLGQVEAFSVDTHMKVSKRVSLGRRPWVRPLRISHGKPTRIQYVGNTLSYVYRVLEVNSYAYGMDQYVYGSSEMEKTQFHIIKLDEVTFEKKLCFF